MGNSEKTIYLHIGTRKTGTSTIQSFFFHNQEKLKKKGVLYPMMLGREIHKIHEIHENLRPALSCENNIFIVEFNPLKMDIKSFLKESFEKNFLDQINSSDCSKVVLSDEALSFSIENGATEAFIDVLKGFGFKVKVIVYFRPAVEYILSLWQQCIKGGGCFAIYSFQEFLYDHSSARNRYSLPRDIYLLPDFIEKVGLENVIIKPFERAQFKNKDLISDFLDIVGLELTEDFDLSKGDQNIGISRNALELNRILNKIGLPYSPERRTILEEMSKNDVKLVETISDEEMLKIRADYADVYKKLASFCSKESLFINDLPKCFGKERPVYEGLILNEERFDIINKAYLTYFAEKTNFELSFVEKIFSVKTQKDVYDNRFKVITILGFSIKFKKRKKA